MVCYNVTSTRRHGDSGKLKSVQPAQCRANDPREKSMIRSYVLAATAALVGVTGTCALAADPLPTETHKLLPAVLAVEAAQTAIATCKGQGYNVSVSIADRAGLPQLLIVGEGAGALSREVPRRKAYTS